MTATTTTAATTSTTSAARRFDWLEFLEKYAILLAWALVIVVFSIWKSETFPTIANFKAIFGSSQVPGILITLGLMAALIVGEFDLSIHGAMSFGASMTAWLNINKHWPILLAIAFVLLCSVVWGLLNALFIIKGDAPSLVTTLGSGFFLQGLALFVIGPSVMSGASSTFTNAATGRFLGLSWAIWFTFILFVISWAVLEHTPIGRYLYFVGKGREVARLAGVRVNRLRTFGLVGSSVLAMGAGIGYVGTAGSAQTNLGLNYLLPAFVGAFLGQTAIKPGQFNVWGTFCAVFFLGTLTAGLNQVGASSGVINMFYGGLLVVAVAASAWAARRRAARVRASDG
jgi:ribose transport system permease protein